MNGSAFATTLPKDKNLARDQAILDACLAGNAQQLIWSPISVVTPNGKHKGTVFVASRSVCVGDVDPLLVATSHLTAQRLADHCSDSGQFLQKATYGAVLLTAKLSDLLYLAAAKKLAEHTQPAIPSERVAKGYSPDMMDTDAMVRHSNEVLSEIRPLGASVLVGPMGKDWACTNKLVGHPDQSGNYGLQSKTGRFAGVVAGVRLWQPGPGLAHEATYTDYSQVVRLARRIMIVDGVERDLEDVARDPELCWLVSSEGVMASLRHPGVQRDGGAPETQRYPMPLFTRLLRYTPPMLMVGDDVRVWQGLVHAKADGVFGPKTMALTKTWQGAHGLVQDGIVGPRSFAAAARDLTGFVTPPGTVATIPRMDNIAFVPAVHYTKGARKTVRLGVIHTMEAAEKPSTAEAVAGWFGGKAGKPPQASSHVCIDNDSIVECVKFSDVAWAAPGANHDGYQAEHAGFARQSAEDWADEYSMAMLALSARFMKRKLVTDPAILLPIQFVDVEGVAGGVKRGFTGHAQISKAFGQSTHTDPGSSFPWDAYLAMVSDAI